MFDAVWDVGLLLRVIPRADLVEVKQILTS